MTTLPILLPPERRPFQHAALSQSDHHLACGPALPPPTLSYAAALSTPSLRPGLREAAVRWLPPHTSKSEQECLAVVWSTAKFRTCLLGQKFSVVTDHNGLTYLMTSALSTNARLARWALKLAEFTFTITYKKGRLHGDADALSRHAVEPPCSTEECYEELPMNSTGNWNL